MCDLNKEQALCKAIAEFDNPLEALGIVMREANITLEPNVPPNRLPGNYRVWFMSNMDVKLIPADSEGSLTGEKILNTLKEGK